MYYTDYFSPLGVLRLVGGGGKLLELQLQPRSFPRGGPAPEEAPERPPLPAARRWLDAYFAGERPDPRSLPLQPAGTAFQLSVWRRLAEIPYGSAVTYGQLARELAACSPSGRMSAQAVGQAVGRNPLPIFIPCHRVLGRNGALTGFSAGLAKKLWLLRHEDILTDADMGGYSCGR